MMRHRSKGQDWMTNDDFRDFADRCRRMAVDEQDHRLREMFPLMAQDYERRAERSHDTGEAHS